MSKVKKHLINGLLLLLIMVAIASLLNFYVFDQSMSPEKIKAMLAQKSEAAPLIFIVTAGIATMIGLPRQVVAFTAGYCFGFSQGVVIATLSAIIGCVTCFYFSKNFAFHYVQQKHGHRITHINGFLAEDTLIKTLIIRLLPVGSNLVTNLVAGVAKIRARDFFIGSAIGYIPQMAIFALSGSGVSLASSNQLIISVCLFFICIGLSAWLYRKYKHSSYITNNN